MKKYRIKSRVRFTTFVTLLIICMVMLAETVFGSTMASSSKLECDTIRVCAGDTLWEIASEYGPDDMDVRKVIHDICDINNIEADQLVAGQKIQVPLYKSV